MTYSDDDVLEWYADATWVKGFLLRLRRDYTFEDEIEEQLEFCDGRLQKLQMSMLRAGLDEVGIDKIVKVVGRAKVDAFRFNTQFEEDFPS